MFILFLFSSSVLSLIFLSKLSPRFLRAAVAAAAAISKKQTPTWRWWFWCRLAEKARCLFLRTNVSDTRSFASQWTEWCWRLSDVYLFSANCLGLTDWGDTCQVRSFQILSLVIGRKRGEEKEVPEKKYCVNITKYVIKNLSKLSAKPSKYLP